MRKSKKDREKVSPAVHDYLSTIGKKGSKAGSAKGGEATRELIEAGKEALGRE